MSCQCEYCRECAYCGHKADEHTCGVGLCYMKKCDCIMFCESLASAWEMMQQRRSKKFSSLQEFLNEMNKENK